MRELVPGSGVRVDRQAGVVEFDGTVPIDAHDPNAPHVYLEVIVCTPDTKEHEALVVTKAKPSHVHAALLLLGLLPGKPGSWAFENNAFRPIDPTGPRVALEFVVAGQNQATDPREWIVDARSGITLGSDDMPEQRGAAGNGFVFAGSRMVKFDGREVYDADGVGTLVGLCAFGCETVAWHRTISPDSAVEAPVWIANPKNVPPVGTALTVRLRRVAN